MENYDLGEYDIVIVGAGPAGLSTALSLRRRFGALAEKTLVLEKGIHPRHKLCGGGLSLSARPALAALGLDYKRIDVPHVVIDEVKIVFAGKTQTVRWPRTFVVVRRNEFDAWLLTHAQRQGVCVRQNTAVQDMVVDQGGVTLNTTAGRVRTRAVIGADGANGVVRRKLKLSDRSRVCRLLELLTPEPEVTGNVAVFDFTPIAAGVQGYSWDFPCIDGGRPFMNRGVFDSRVDPTAPGGDLRRVLADELGRRGKSLEDGEVMGCPERWFDRGGQYCRPRVVLAGDAAGIDPLLGEGIAYALMYGPTVAALIAHAFARNDLNFADYDAGLKRSPLGRQLALRTRMARFAYRQKPERVGQWWFLVGLAARVMAWRCSGRI